MNSILRKPNIQTFGIIIYTLNNFGLWQLLSWSFDFECLQDHVRVEDKGVRILRLRIREQGPPDRIPSELLLGMSDTLKWGFQTLKDFRNRFWILFMFVKNPVAFHYLLMFSFWGIVIMKSQNKYIGFCLFALWLINLWVRI